MAINVYRMDLSNHREREEAISFLQANHLQPEPLDTAFALRDTNQRLIGFGGRAKDVLKCFAFDPVYRGQALLDPLISELITDAFTNGIEDLLIYTRIEYRDLFSHFRFTEVAHTDTVVLLHRGTHTPQAAMDALLLAIQPEETVGAIVMNANPFTLGHRALVDTAAKQVERLLVFVVEHDASQLPFADRIRLVQEGVADLPHVSVVPSTRYIISAATFPSYFLKEKERGNAEHAKLDAAIFARYFVPRYHIGKRFVGEEPADPTTALYNAALANILPPACEVIVVPRKKSGHAPISASTVRALVKARDWKAVRELVPDTSYRYLRDRYD